MPKLLTPQVDPGKSIEIEIYFTGTGEVEKNKLFVSYPTAIISKENPGEIISSISVASDKRTGKIIQPLSGKKQLTTQKIEPEGTIIRLNKGNFLNYPLDQVEGPILPIIMSEKKGENYPPILLKLNIGKNAPSGDFDIGMAFTYSNSEDIEISKEIAKVHVTSWSDRYGRTAIIIGIAGVILSTIIGILALL